jgi:DNA-binding CsgD family transcriptional regulator
MMALLIERNPVSADLFAIAEKFDLTQREYEAVRHLASGLTSKGIAARMGISANTVKAFLRLAMIKTGVSTRSGLIGKFVKSA